MSASTLKEAPKPRGRPATGRAMTAAERKAAQRARMIEQANTLMDGANDHTLAPDQLATLSLDLLFALARRLITSGWPERMELGAAELMRRARANDQS
jgi:hypothetical protein